MEVWFNPSCSKCRTAVGELESCGIDVTLRRYLDDTPSAEELDAALVALGLQPWDIARTGEPVAAEIGLKDLPHDRDVWIRTLVEHPKLIQRPILVAADGTAYIGRDAEGIAAAVAAERAAPKG